MHAILADWQINMLAVVFQKEKFQINASRIVLPPQFSLNWEVVGTMAPQGAFFPNEDFLENIEEYKYNKFLNIGKCKDSLSNCTLNVATKCRKQLEPEFQDGIKTKNGITVQIN